MFVLIVDITYVIVTLSDHCKYVQHVKVLRLSKKLKYRARLCCYLVDEFSTFHVRVTSTLFNILNSCHRPRKMFEIRVTNSIPFSLFCVAPDPAGPQLLHASNGAERGVWSDTNPLQSWSDEILPITSSAGHVCAYHNFSLICLLKQS